MNPETIEKVETFGSILTVADLAAIIRVSEKTLYRLVKTRKLPALRIGGSVRLDPRITANWLRSRMS